ncbi:MAG: Spy/CpxP family protein refolding chaperone [Deltaproteobacteria bacterium]|nr:Spy/CpxP family protein refolding chaperone [Deltaproteobacteria bacterium]
MKSKTLIAALALTIVLAGAYAVNAMHSGGHSGFTGVMGSRILGLKTLIQLNLSDSQKSRILSIIEKYENDIESAKNNLREARHNIRAAMQAGEFNENAIRNAHRQAAPIKEELLVLGAKMKAEMKTVLTPEQLQLLEERKAERIERFRDRLDSRFENHKD